MLAAYEHEWFGLDLDSGAFVRIVGTEVPQRSAPGSYRVVEVTLGSDPGSMDPARPELVVALPTLGDLGEIRQRRTRRLLRAIVAADRPGATVLGTRGPSVAFVDLDGTSPSLTLLSAKHAALELFNDGDSTVLAVGYGGVTQRFPVLDPGAVAAAARVRPRSVGQAALNAEIGYRVGYVLIGLGAVEGGHVRKVVFALLPRARG